MSRSRRPREEYTSSHWESGRRDECGWGRYTPPPPEFLTRNSFNYWRSDDFVVPTSYYPQRSYEQESYDERLYDDNRSLQAESSHSRPRRRSGLGRAWSGRSPPHQNLSHQRYSTYTPSYNPRPTIRPRSPIESIHPLPQSVPLEPPRRTSPPPDMSSRPSTGYLSLSQEPSEILRNPEMTRKLLVLDLNGTLLIRSPRSRATSGPQVRRVQPRPYMQSFRQYLFCLPTKAWLDTMVWSSAQPHSVDDMVDKVFGPTKGELKAVWNRKSLGLSEADYHRKMLTTKDLTKAWDLFASSLGSEHSAAPPQSRVTHSMLTTLLLDDSPHKAALQPYNHVCITEYDSTKRQHDLRSLMATRGSKQHKKEKMKSSIKADARSPDLPVPELLLLESTEKEPYDTMLLAVIGILETVKSQSNVAGWIRRGGLWATQEEGSALDAKIRDSKTVSDAVVRTGDDANSTSHLTTESEQARLQTEVWFSDASVVAFWVARGRKALMELGIQVIHGVTG